MLGLDDLLVLLLDLLLFDNGGHCGAVVVIFLPLPLPILNRVGLAYRMRRYQFGVRVAVGRSESNKIIKLWCDAVESELFQGSSEKLVCISRPFPQVTNFVLAENCSCHPRPQS